MRRRRGGVAMCGLVQFLRAPFALRLDTSRPSRQGKWLSKGFATIPHCYPSDPTTARFTGNCIMTHGIHDRASHSMSQLGTPNAPSASTMASYRHVLGCVRDLYRRTPNVFEILTNCDQDNESITYSHQGRHIDPHRVASTHTNLRLVTSTHTNHHLVVSTHTNHHLVASTLSETYIEERRTYPRLNMS
jgi:hypothetical protein